MFCQRCGSPNSEAAHFCEKCGTSFSAVAAPPNVAPPPVQGSAGSYPTSSAAAPRQQPIGFYPDPRIRGGQAPIAPGVRTYAVGKSPGVALLLSFLIPGVGQFYVGDAKKGGIMLAIFFVSCWLTLVVVGVVGVLGVWIWSMIDAYNIASGKTPLS